MRSGELRRLQLDGIDWMKETIRIVRSKSGRQDTYPLDATVGNAIARYLRHGRPRSDSRVLFLTIQAPFRPLSPAALAYMVRSRLARVISTRKGLSPHALRHACARHLVDAGLTLKEIGDHLGHRCPEATRIYTKVDLTALRLVALEDLGSLA
jgi:site-specific recombinase XerD